MFSEYMPGRSALTYSAPQLRGVMSENARRRRREVDERGRVRRGVLRRQGWAVDVAGGVRRDGRGGA